MDNCFRCFSLNRREATVPSSKRLLGPYGWSNIRNKNTYTLFCGLFFFGDWLVASESFLSKIFFAWTNHCRAHLVYSVGSAGPPLFIFILRKTLVGGSSMNVIYAFHWMICILLACQCVRRWKSILGFVWAKAWRMVMLRLLCESLDPVGSLRSPELNFIVGPSIEKSKPLRSNTPSVRYFQILP